MKTGSAEYIFYAGAHWKQFDFKNGIKNLLKTRNPEFIYKAGTLWSEFDYYSALKILESEVTSGEIWRGRMFENRKWKTALKIIWESSWN